MLATKRWKKRTTRWASAKTYVFVVALKRALLNQDSAKCRFKIFQNFSYEEQLTVSFISFWFYQAVDWRHKLGECNVSKQVQWNPDFSNPQVFDSPDNSNQKSFPSPQSNAVTSRTVRFLKAIFISSLGGSKNSKFGCVSAVLTVSLDVRTGNVFVFTAIRVRIYNWRFRAFCNFFQAIRSPSPEVRWCLYAYVWDALLTWGALLT